MASDYLRQNPATSAFVVGMTQGQNNTFLFPSSEREGDGKISQGKITSKKKTVSSTRYEQNPSPGIMVEIVAATHSLRNGTELAPAEIMGVLCASCKPFSGPTCPHMFDSCSDVATALG